MPYPRRLSNIPIKTITLKIPVSLHETIKQHTTTSVNASINQLLIEAIETRIAKRWNQK